MNHRCLVFETTPSLPHTETGLEILLLNAKAGTNCTYAPLFLHLPIWEMHMLRSRQAREDIKQFVGKNILQIASQCADIFHPTPIQSPPVPLAPDFNKDSLLDNKWPIGRAIYTTLTSGMKTHNPNMMSALHRPITELFFYVTQRVFVYAQQAIEQTKPDTVYIFNGRLASTAACIWACEKAGVKWVIHERASTKDKFALYTDYPQKVDVWGKWIRDYCTGVDLDVMRLIGGSYYKDRVLGKPRDYFSFTKRQEKGFLPPHLKKKPYVAFYVSSEDEISGLSANQVLDLGWGGQREAFCTLKEHCKRLGHHLVVRVHPHLSVKSEEESQFWASQNTHNVEVLPADSPVCTYTLMRHAQVVATYMSSVGIEAVYWEKPVLLLGRSYYFEMAGPFIPQTDEALCEFLNHPRKPKDLSDAWRWGYFHETFGINYRFYEAKELFVGKFLGVDLWREVNEKAKKRRAVST